MKISTKEGETKIETVTFLSYFFYQFGMLHSNKIVTEVFLNHFLNQTEYQTIVIHAIEFSCSKWRFKEGGKVYVKFKNTLSKYLNVAKVTVSSK